MNYCPRCYAHALAPSAILISVLSTPAAALAQGAEQPSASQPQPGAASTASAPKAEPAAAKWYDKVKLEGFVDAYANVNYNLPKPQTGQNLGRSFDTANGFALHWAGLNASYDPEPVGGTIGLRFGPGASTYNGSDLAMGTNGTTFVKQAFVSWKPGGGPLTFDLGKFDTWIGAEVADSQYNMNYTRSFLFNNQPLTHTGLRIDWAINEMFDLKLFAVNGWNVTLDNNGGKTFGAAFGVTPNKDLSFSLGWIGGPEQADMVKPADDGDLVEDRNANSRWRNFFDFIADYHPGKFHGILNVDVGNEKTPAGTIKETSEESTTWYGGNLTLGYAFTDVFAAALRGGYFHDPDGWVLSGFDAILPALGHKSDWVDVTLTLAATPVSHLIIKLDGRIDSASVDTLGDGIFPKSPSSNPATTKTQFTTTLGVVATTN